MSWKAEIFELIFAVLHFLDRLTSGTLPRLICRSFQLQWITVTLKMLSWCIYSMHTQDDINGTSQISVGTVLLSRAAQSWCTPLVEIYCTNCFSSKITSRHHPTSCRNFVEEHDFWLLSQCDRISIGWKSRMCNEFISLQHLYGSFKTLATLAGSQILQLLTPNNVMYSCMLAG